MALTQIDDRGLKTPIDLIDNEKIRLGTGNDLELYHDASNSFTINNTGNYLIKSAGDVYLRTATNEDAVACIANGAVELYFNNAKTFETISGGAKITGHFVPSGTCNLGAGDNRFNDLYIGNDVVISDNGKIQLGAGPDLEIYHNGSHSYIDENGTGILAIRSNGTEVAISSVSGESMGRFINDGAVELYYDNSKKLDTHSGGINVTGSVNPTGNVALLDNSKLKLGTGDDLQIYHDGTDSIIKAAGSATPIKIQGYSSNTSTVHISARSDKETIKCLNNTNAPYVELYYDNSKKFETTSSGVDITGGGVNTVKITGTGSHELYSYGDTGGVGWCTGAGAGNYGELIYFDEGSSVIQLYAAGEIGLSVTGNGAVDLYYDNSKKLYTYSEGVKVDGYMKALFDVSDSHWGDNTSNWHQFQNKQDESHTVIFENSSDSTPYGNLIYFSDAAPDDSTRSFYQFADNAASRCFIYSDGDLWNHDNSYTGSDETLKENIVDATPKLEDLKKLKVRNFNWKADYFPNKSKKKQLGFIAQEVEQVFPSLVSEHDISPGLHTSPDHTPVMKKAIKQAWDPIIIKAMQELITKIETLETKVAALEAA